MLDCNHSNVLKKVSYFYGNIDNKIKVLNFDAMISVVAVHVDLSWQKACK